MDQESIKENKGLFFLTDRQRRLFRRKEIKFVRQGFINKIELNSSRSLKDFIKLSRALHRKYHSLTQGQTEVPDGLLSFKTHEMEKMFERLMAAFDRQARKKKMKDLARKGQAKLDRDQHYDIDGATIVHGHVYVT